MAPLKRDICPLLHVGFLYCLQLMLEGPDDILAFEFCPSDPNIIVGGCINGQVLKFPLDCRTLPSLLPSLYAGGNRLKLIIHQTRLVVVVACAMPLIVCCCCFRLYSGTFLLMSQSYRPRTKRSLTTVTSL